MGRDVRARRALEAIALAGALLFVVGMTYLPHADSARQAPDDGAPALWRLARVYVDLFSEEIEPYEYTVHVDENMHWSRMASIERAETLRAEGIYDVVPEGGALDLRGLVHERGFFVALVHVHQLTGLEWIDIIHYLPALWAGVTAYLVWAALRPWPGAPIAAALVGLVPTSARFLGPGFLVPIGFGLAWIAAALCLMPTAKPARANGPLLVLITIWAFFIHLIAGFAVLMLLLLSLPLQGRNVRSFAVLTLTAALPLVVLLDVFSEGVNFEIERIGTLPIDLTVFDQIGLPFLAVWALGCAVALVWTRDAGLLLRASALASMAALGFIVLAITTRTFHYAIYDRWHQPFVLFAAIPAAAGVVFLAERAVAAARHARLDARAAAPLAAVVLALGLATATSTGVAGHLREPYYHVIDDADWEAFTWAAQNVNASNGRFLADAYKAPVFHALTGMQPHTWLVPGATPERAQDYDNASRESGVWFVERNVTLVFRTDVRAPEFEPAREGVWTLDEWYARELGNVSAMEAQR